MARVSNESPARNLGEEVQADLRIIGIAITNRCNLSCGFCSRSSCPNERTDLSIEKVEEIVDDAVSIASSQLAVSITGGEPALHPEFRELVRRIAIRPVTISVNTNGLGMSAETAAYCAEIGVGNLAFSLDGPRRLYEQRLDGARAYDTVVGNIQAVRVLGMPFTLGCTITPSNLDGVLELLHVARDLGASGISLSRVYPIGRALRDYEAHFVGWSDFVRVARACKIEEAPDFFVAIEDNTVRHLYDDAYCEARALDPKSSAGGWNGCFAGVILAQVEANGLVLPCAFLGAPAGSVHESSFADIWTNSPVMQSLRRRDKLTGSCGGCQEKAACGGCRGRAFGLHGDYYAEDPLCPLSAGGAETLPR